MFIYEGCSENFCIFSFLSLLDTLSLVQWSCDHLVIANIVLIFDIYIYIYIWCCYHFHLSLHVLFIFSFYTHISYYVCNHIFLFHTKMLWWVLFKVSQKDRLSKSIMPWTLILQSFSRFCARIRFYCIQWVIMSWVIYDFSHISFVCCGFVTDCQSGRLIGHMWNMLWTYVILNWLIFWQNALYL